MENYKRSNKNRVIETAASLFLKVGYTYTSMDEVVQQSGVSKSNVYYHFSSKEELLLAVIDFWIIIYREKLADILKQTNLTLEEKMLTFLQSLAEEIEERDYQGSCPFITFIMQAPKNDRQVQEKINHFFDYLTRICEGLIQEGINTKAFREDINVKETAEIFVNNLEGALFLAEVKKESQYLTTTAKNLFKLLV